MELDSWVLAASLAVLTASLVQGTTGFGFGIVALPSLALVVPDRLPQILIIMGLIISIWVIVRDHAAIEWRVASWLVPSRALGVVPGAALVAALSDRTLDIAFGVVGLLAVLSLLAPRRKQESTRLQLAGAGLVAGAMGTSTGLGGPPLLPVIGHLDAKRQRATLAVVFAIGSALSLVALRAVGRLTPDDLTVTGLLLPSLAVGMWGSKYLLRVSPEHVLRMCIVLLGTIASIILLGRGLLDA